LILDDNDSEDDTSGEENSEDESSGDTDLEFGITQNKRKVETSLRVYTYQELKAVLLDECNDHFRSLPSIDTISFHPCPASRLKLNLIPTSDKRMLFGSIDSAIPKKRD
jgi:hypothetical protein